MEALAVGGNDSISPSSAPMQLCGSSTACSGSAISNRSASEKEAEVISGGVEPSKLHTVTVSENGKVCKQFLAQNSAVVVRPLFHGTQSTGTNSSSVTTPTPPPPPTTTTTSSSNTSGSTHTNTHGKSSGGETNGKTAESVSPNSSPDSPLTMSVSCKVDFVARRSLLRYKCDMCGRECPSKHKLKRHLSTHSEARPFPCGICGRTFKWTEYLQKHMRQQHARDVVVLGAKLALPSKTTRKRNKSSSRRTAKELTVALSPHMIEENDAVGASTSCSEEQACQDQTVKREGGEGSAQSGKETAERVQSVKEVAGSVQEEVSHGPLKHSVSVGVDMDTENLDSEDSLDGMSDQEETDMLAIHGLQDLSYESHTLVKGEGPSCYNVQQSDGGCVALTNTYASCGAGTYLSGPCSTSYSTAVPQEQRGQFCASLPCQTPGLTCQTPDVNGSFSIPPHSQKQFFIPSTNYFKPSTQMCGPSSQINVPIYPDPSFQTEFLDPSAFNALGASSQANGDLTVANSCATLPHDYDLHNNLSNYPPSLISTGNAEFHDSTQTPSLNFTTTNHFYTANGKLQDSYSDVQKMDYGANSMDGMHGQSCSLDAVLQTFSDTTPQLNEGPLPGMYEPMNTYQSVAVNNSVGENPSNYHLNSCTFQDSGTSHFSSQCCVVPDNQFVMSKCNPLQQNATVDQKPFLQFTGGVSLSESNSVEEEEQLTEAGATASVCVNIGIQCEVGPETLLALQEEEDEGELVEGFEVGDTSDLSQTKEGASISGSDILSDDRLIQKYPCRVESCNKAYIHRKDVIRHMRIRHGMTPKKLEAVIVETPEKPHICGVKHCRRSYFHMKDLKRHQRLCHHVNLGSPEAEKRQLGEKLQDSTDPNQCQMRFPCDFPGCLRSYVHKKDLIRHKRLYHKDASIKPSIPLAVRYTDSELKHIRQRVKQEIDTKVEKFRLDSTGSNTSVSTNNDEDCTNNIVCVTSDKFASETNCTILLSSSSLLQNMKPSSGLDLGSAMSGDLASILGAIEQHGHHIFRS